MAIMVMPGVELPDDALEERFVRASGPGGQNVNKVSTAVELRLAVGRSLLAPDVARRLRALAGKRLTAEDVLIVESREHRTQMQNREAAVGRLVALVRSALVPPKRRRPTRAPKTVDLQRLASKRQRSQIKARRKSGRDDGE